MLAILDYKAGNQTSVLRALRSLDIPAEVTASPEVIMDAEGVIFPGVGAAGQAMAQLTSTGMDRILRRCVEAQKPLLGICLGCQILLERSEENDTPTLGIVPGVCRRFLPEWEDGGRPIRIPHMGWNSIKARPSALLEGITSDAQFYFVHSFYPDPAPEWVIATCTYGRTFAAIYGRPGLWAVQFHPEKSGRPGLRLLSNFYRCCRQAKETTHV
ncbi:imidazole glycerol phosphate synthase subunit HisH [uncultured Mailhella sp.]|uniref:imidazole glycerol phosphate synthase subunit HisH n=1 Tax=uncultured Mailhella sp. TaxID=1981031 RepID=UPI00262DE4CC|nr:imidazole glycerol phosphate synthase subunit HisH [uncultured Mailhella sp.]